MHWLHSVFVPKFFFDEKHSSRPDSRLARRLGGISLFLIKGDQGRIKGTKGDQGGSRGIKGADLGYRTLLTLKAVSKMNFWFVEGAPNLA